MAEIIFDKVTKKYTKGINAISDINLKIKNGEFMVVVGPSGCGKSTLLRIVAGLEIPTFGSIIFEGQKVNDISPNSRNVAMVFQDYALYPHLSVFENIAFGLRVKKLPEQEIKHRVHEAALLLNIKAYLQRKPKELSGGQRQRVALGRAIVRKPDVYLFDEPLSNLDAKLRVQMRTEIIKIYERHKITTVYVTHDQVEAMAMGQRIAILKGGVIQQVDTPENIFNKPKNKFVASFIGSPPMNFFNGKIIFSGKHLKISGNDFQFVLPQTKFGNLKQFINSEITIGIRPADFSLNDGKSKIHIFDSTIDFIEKLGTDSYAYFNRNNSVFAVRLRENSKIKDKTNVKLYADFNNIYIFDLKTEEALI